MSGTEYTISWFCIVGRIPDVSALGLLIKLSETYYET